MAETFHLAPATPSDIPSMIEVYLSAFVSNPLTSFCFPLSAIGEVEIRAWMTSFLSNHFTHPEIHFYKITETHSGELAAWMRCSYPYVMSAEEKESREKEKGVKVREGRIWPKGANLEVLGAKFGVLEGVKERFFEEGDMYYVQLMATSPAFQKMGLASRLLSVVMEMADSEGRKIYIEASDAGFPVYEKLGWRLVDTVEVDLRKWGGEGIGRNRVMLRDPQPLR